MSNTIKEKKFEFTVNDLIKEIGCSILIGIGMVGCSASLVFVAWMYSLNFHSYMWYYVFLSAVFFGLGFVMSLRAINRIRSFMDFEVLSK